MIILIQDFWFDEDCYINKDTNWIAKVSASIGIESVKKVESGEWERAFAVCRPPGHHSSDRIPIAGFCFYNNLMLAVRYLQRTNPKVKIAILDWDVH